MYELLTFVDEPRPHVIIEYPARVVFTFEKKDEAYALEILDRLNNPELILLDEADDVVNAA